ncbi:MAG: type II secretion system protein GspG [Acidobacteriota bacterium]
MKKQKGFTLIELLIVVAIIGIIAAIAIPNLLSAIQRAKQKRAMGEVNSLATAFQSYATDTNVYPVQSTPAAATSISAAITPDYIKVVPNPDPWNTAYQYQGVTSEYAVASWGKDGTADANGWTAVKLTPADSSYYSQNTTCFECDIVWEGSSFLISPGGKQATCK